METCAFTRPAAQMYRGRQVWILLSRPERGLFFARQALCFIGTRLRTGSWFPLFAKSAKNGAPTVLVMLARSRAPATRQPSS